MRQLCIVVGTSGSMLLEDLINNFILTASVLSSLTYLIRWYRLYSAVQKKGLYYFGTRKNGAILRRRASWITYIQSSKNSTTSTTLSIVYISLITNLEVPQQLCKWTELPIIELVLPSPSSRKTILSYFSGQQTARILTQ